MICGIDLDSRRVDAGALFSACSGATTHGIDFAACACDRGVAVIAAEPDCRWGEALQERGGINA